MEPEQQQQQQHVVVFECADLSAEHKRRIRNYFSVRRKSGGGECGEVMRVHGDVYEIAFQDQQVQKRVLQKAKHVVEVPGGSLVLTVRDGSSSTGNQPQVPKTKPRTLLQNQLPITEIPPPTGEEHELHLDSYVFRFLKETPKAQSDVEGNLALLGCAVPLYSGEGTVVVRRSLQPGATRDSAEWTEKVEEVFKGYTSHYECSARQVKALLHSDRTSDEVKIYSEAGITVVAGERSQVNDRVKNIEDSPVKPHDSSEKRTTVRRLSEAKLRLLWAEMEGSLREFFSGVEVKRGDPGQLILSGSAEEIRKAVQLISHREDSVLERIVADKSPYFLAFLRNVYGGPGVLGDLLRVGDQVEIEIGDTELHLFSLSAEKLDHTKKKVEETFMDVKIGIPSCSFDPKGLQEKFKSKLNEMNQGACRVEVVCGLDGTVWLLGHTKEVQELSESVNDFILDQASIEGTVLLPFPDLAQLLPDLLQHHGFDHSGVTLIPLPSSSEPKVALQGPSSKVMEVRNRLGPFLDSLVQERVTVDLPSAVRYFESQAGREGMSSIARSQRSLIQLEQPPHVCHQSSGSAKYVLQDNLQVLVCQGDITKQYADALVNAANNTLEHSGGVAAALSQAGGAQVQKESKSLVKQMGKIPTGDAVVTTGGNLKCKKLLHVVGPIQGRVGGNEGKLVEKAVQSALNLAETMELGSIAIPCISSGLYGVPLTVCAEGIVTAIKTFASQGGRSLNQIILIDQKAEVVRALQDACDRLLQATTASRPRAVDLQGAVGGASAGARGGAVHVEVIYGTIQAQQVDVLVAPMVGLDPKSTRVGFELCEKVGPELQAKFTRAAAAMLQPGDTVVVENLPALRTRAVVFVWLTARKSDRSSDQVLRAGIRQTLDACESRGFTCVALPSLGVGAVLGFPHSVAFNILLEEINAFERRRVGQVPFKVRVVLHPKDSEANKALQSAMDTLRPGGLMSDADPHRNSFYRPVSTTANELTAMLGGVKLQMVQGDIIHAGTDVIVNSMGRSSQDTGVSKAILTAAGPTVHAELAQVPAVEDFMRPTGPGLLGCREIVHARFRNSTDTIHKYSKEILKHCERRGYQSVAFPAVNTGQAGMDATKACKAMLDGMVTAVRDMNPQVLSLIRIVILEPPIFRAFRAELENRFGQSASPKLTIKEKAHKKLNKFRSKVASGSAPGAEAIAPFKPKPAVVSVISCGPDVIQVIHSHLEELLKKQLVERQVEVEHFSKLNTMELEAVLAKVRVLGISLEFRTVQAPGAASKDSPGYVLKGLKEDVLSILELVNQAVQQVLCNDLQAREEAMVALRVQWSIKALGGDWQELSLHYNHLLETARCTKRRSVDVPGPDSNVVTVDVEKLEAVDPLTDVTYKVKRNESETDLEVPPQWETMHLETFKKVEVHPSSPEYQRVAADFQRTANSYTIHKMERVQNLFLWQAFSVYKQRMIAKNGVADLGEQLVYHGTSATSCDCIEKGWFDRGFAGAHAARYGKGVYFSITAQYSARSFSPADSAGMKRLYVARVLTGRYTVGEPSMKTPPPRGTDPTDCYDSLVDNQQNPTMYIIFHDDQAYPEYLVTFS